MTDSQTPAPACLPPPPPSLPPLITFVSLLYTEASPLIRRQLGLVAL